MKPAFLGTIKKNLFGIITAVLSAGVLLGFLFSALFFGRDNYPRHGCLENHVLLSEFPHRMYLHIYCRPVA